MASAGGIDGGRTPGNISAWGRVRAGWIQEVVLHYPTNITLPNPNATDAVYRINTQTPNEYFLIENRTTASKWDTGIPSSGMLIYHVDMNNPGWNNNCVNCNPARRGNYIKQAGGNAGSTSGNRTADPWPQPHMGRTEYTDWSTPDSKSWAGANTNKPITNIIRDAEEGTVSFDILGGPTDYFIFLSENQVIFQNPGINYDEVTPQTITITNFGTSPTGELSITLTGENPNSFTASPTTIPSIEIDGNGSFTIVPNVGLDFGTYTATVTVGNDNVSESFSVVFEVAKLEGANVSTPTLADITFNSITVNSIDEPANGQTVEYTISTGQVIDETIMDWQVETTFTGLNSRTNYFVFARSAENEFFFAGRTSISTRFLTLFNSSDISDIEIETSLKVFPNPVTNGELKIENGEWKSGDIVEIYNLIEKRVYSKQISFTIHHSPLIINISHLPNGMYIVKIGKFSSRIIKQ
jgi:hypothetical protein